MTYRERTKAVCASILLILKNATVVIPVVEGIIYAIWDILKPQKKEQKNGTKEVEFEERTTDSTADEQISMS